MTRSIFLTGLTAKQYISPNSNKSNSSETSATNSDGSPQALMPTACTLQNFKAWTSGAPSVGFSIRLRVSSSAGNVSTMGASTIGACSFTASGSSSCTGSGTQSLGAGTLVGLEIDPTPNTLTQLFYVSAECK